LGDFRQRKSPHKSILFIGPRLSYSRVTNFYYQISISWKYLPMECLFYNIPNDRVIASNELTYAIQDGFSVTALHTPLPPRHKKEA
jgi:hypothetical protein